MNTASVAPVFSVAAGSSTGFSEGASVTAGDGSGVGVGAAVAVGSGLFSRVSHAVKLTRRQIDKTRISIFFIFLSHFHGILSTECD